MKCHTLRRTLAIATLAVVSFVPSLIGQSADAPTAEKPSLSKVWVADNGDGTYKNPVLYADYSDPDAIRVGDDYYLVASSFADIPGLPILHSKDLVNWTILSHALKKQPPYEVYGKAQHGNGVWAPSIRYHNGEYYIYYPDPDYGIYLIKAKSPQGPWSEPTLLKTAKGWIDPCPLWDDDGNAYLVNALAASRSGAKSILIVSKMSPDGTKLLDDGVMVFDGHAHHPTTEGPKLYKRNGYYYIFAPAGGVPTGWQLVLRSKNIYGPYEEKIVMAQGKSPTNGPHQGAWVETQTGESWFLHFQDQGPYGRVVHLQPMKWIKDWPVIGMDKEGKGTGEPVLSYKKPNVGKTWPKATPADSDEFNENGLGLQWQWQANPGSTWMFPSGALGILRLFNVALPEDYKNFWNVPNLLLQKFPAPEFTVTTKVTFTPRADGEKTGLVVMGQDYAYVSLQKTPGGLVIAQSICKNAAQGAPEKENAPVQANGDTFYFRVKVTKGAKADFSYSTDGSRFLPIGESFQAKEGLWIGAKVGLFAVANGQAHETGYADYDWFRFESTP